MPFPPANRLPCCNNVKKCSYTVTHLAINVTNYAKMTDA